jgi:hypothetical protein
MCADLKEKVGAAPEKPFGCFSVLVMDTENSINSGATPSNSEIFARAKSACGVGRQTRLVD